jgi:hypothetical protein
MSGTSHRIQPIGFSPFSWSANQSNRLTIHPMRTEHRVPSRGRSQISCFLQFSKVHARAVGRRLSVELEVDQEYQDERDYIKANE